MASVLRVYCILFVLLADPVRGLFWSSDSPSRQGKQPNIVLVVADDLGYGDVGYHGSKIRTPNLDRLAQTGVKLENYYVQPTCTPTRSTLLTGKYTIRTGLQHGVIRPCQAIGVPVKLPLLPGLLQQAGYSTYGVGKWHVGHYRREMLPTQRGFDRFFGFYTGSIDYYSHDRQHEGYWGLDMHDDEEPAWDTVNTYSTHLFTDKAVEYLREHNSSKPFFLYLAYQAVHSPLTVSKSCRSRYHFFSDRNRRKYASMVSCLDEGIGNLTRALKHHHLWENTVFIFTSDNGASRKDGGSNDPLRGGKGSMWEGGIRAVGFVHGAMIPRGGVINRQLIHVADWLPTLVSLAGGDLSDALPLDGYNQWETIANGSPSPRKEFLVNINPLTPKHGQEHYKNLFDTRVRAAIRINQWKLITGNPGSDPDYDDDDDDRTNEERNMQNDGAGSTPSFGWQLKIGPNTRFSGVVTTRVIEEKHAKNLWLFDVVKDPLEKVDLSDKRPDVVQSMLQRLMEHAQKAVSPQRVRSDPRCDPHIYGGVWEPWN